MFSRSSLPPAKPPLPLCRPIASISSMKIIEGFCSLALANKSRTREGPTPTNISIKSEPEIDKNGTPDSPAVAFASKVFPVPGGPTKRAPRGIFAPNFSYFSGDFKKSTNSMISLFASSHPATSLNITFGAFLSNVAIVALPTLKIPPPGPPPPPPIPPIPPTAPLRIKYNHPAKMAIVGNARKISPCQYISETYVTGTNFDDSTPMSS